MSSRDQSVPSDEYPIGPGEDLLGNSSVVERSDDRSTMDPLWMKDCPSEVRKMITRQTIILFGQSGQLLVPPTWRAILFDQSVQVAFAFKTDTNKVFCGGLNTARTEYLPKTNDIKQGFLLTRQPIEHRYLLGTNIRVIQLQRLWCWQVHVHADGGLFVTNGEEGSHQLISMDKLFVPVFTSRPTMTFVLVLDFRTFKVYNVPFWPRMKISDAVDFLHDILQKWCFISEKGRTTNDIHPNRRLRPFVGELVRLTVFY